MKTYKDWESYPEWKKSLIRTFNRTKVIVLHDWKYNVIYTYLGVKYYIDKKLGKPVHYYCNFCKCSACKYGWIDHKTYHAPTSAGGHICDVCYAYDVCTSGPNRNPEGPCENKDCEHRPKLIGPFI